MRLRAARHALRRILSLSGRKATWPTGQAACKPSSVPIYFKAFDRLEVAEFSAQSLLDTALIGSHAPIGDAEITDLKQAFGLEPETA